MRSRPSLPASVALASLALASACGSGSDPSASGHDVASVLVATGGDYVGSAVVDAQGRVILTAGETLAAVTFAPDSLVSGTWGAPTSQPQVELALQGNTLWWAANDEGKQSVLWTLPTGSIVQNPAPFASFPGSYGGDVVGLVADGKAVYAAVSTPTPASIGLVVPPPDSWTWPGNPVVTTPFTGAIYRIGTSPLAPAAKLPGPAAGITFFPGFLAHVLAQSSTEVYWADSTKVGPETGRVMAASKAAWATDTGRRLGGIQPVNGVDFGFVGLAADDANVAWAVAAQPYPGATGCQVWAAPTAGAPRAIFDSNLAGTPFLCDGLAIDAQYAYFAMVQVYVPPAGPGSSALLGTGIARVPLAGGPLQTVSLQSDRWYGPRRMLVDNQYVYALDPSYVLRFPKTAFGP